ncbi:hypothetical protein DH09_05310 [Bacillaceae bacterium JMAK1]|nr:hypothetical protein DH09_05310 [Bacillaceae bacterium JMAK1]
MKSQERIDRMNELAKRSRTIGLSSREIEEQQSLRVEYFDNLRNTFRNQLQSVTLVNEDGQDVTPREVDCISPKRSY